MFEEKKKALIFFRSEEQDTTASPAQEIDEDETLLTTLVSDDIAEGLSGLYESSFLAPEAEHEQEGDEQQADQKAPKDNQKADNQKADNQKAKPAEKAEKFDNVSPIAPIHFHADSDPEEETVAELHIPDFPESLSGRIVRKEL